MPPAVLSKIRTLRNPPEPVVAPGGPKIEKVYDFSYNEDHELIIVEAGERCPFEDIQACRPETLSEIAARSPGKNNLEKLQNLAASGIIATSGRTTRLSPDDPAGSEIVDERGMPTSIVEADAMMRKGRAAVRDVPADLLAGVDVSNIDAVLEAIGPEKVKAYYEKLTASKETTKDE